MQYSLSKQTAISRNSQSWKRNRRFCHCVWIAFAYKVDWQSQSCGDLCWQRILWVCSRLYWRGARNTIIHNSILDINSKLSFWEYFNCVSTQGWLIIPTWAMWKSRKDIVLTVYPLSRGFAAEWVQETLGIWLWINWPVNIIKEKC